MHGKMIKFPGLRPVEPEVTLDDVEAVLAKIKPSV